MWTHLLETVLGEYLGYSLALGLLVAGGSMLIGTSLAWLVCRYDFPGRSLLQWLLLLPLAMPAYIIAYTYTGWLDFAGPVQSALRAAFDWGYGDYYFPEVRSFHGAVLMLSLVLYPYVYLLARAAFSQQSQSLFDVSRSMGLGGLGYFWRVALPLARPAIVAGGALAMMEALADYGTVQYFGIPTFTTGIFRTWFGMGKQQGAAQLASLLCTFVLVVLVLEQYSRRQRRYYQQAVSRRITRQSAGWGITLYCFIWPFFGFVLPACILIRWVWLSGLAQLNADFMALIYNSFFLALSAAVLLVILALLYGYSKRLLPGAWVGGQVRLVSLGYALPGTVIAVGLLAPLGAFDQQLNRVSLAWFDIELGLLLSGSLFALLFCYAVRFLAVALNQVETGLERITPSMDQAARSLGLSPIKVLRQIHLPLLGGSLLSALLLVFVDVLKELPATLILRPFNFNTLAVRTFELASDERLQDAALPALMIVLVGLLPVILLTRALDKQHA